jgi:HEAT repeat protein
MVTEKEIPQCCRSIPRLNGKTWWLTKQTWIFQPAEMRDLEFQPAIPALAEKLDEQDGYFAAANLAPLGSNAVPVLLAALDGTNRTARLNAASVLEQLNDPQVVEQLDKLLTDPEPEVRAHAIDLARHQWNPGLIDEFLGLLGDSYPEIRRAAAMALLIHRDQLSPCIPTFQQMLKDTNLHVRASGMRMLNYLHVPVPREALLEFFKLPDREGISLALDQLRNRNSSGSEVIQLGGIHEYTGVSDAEAVPLLQNPDLIARMIGLRILYANAEKQSVELALPLLKDPEPMVRRRTAATLRALTGQHFTEDQSDQWEKWWNENQATFVVELHPEALRPEWRGTNEIWWPTTNRPAASVP